MDIKLAKILSEGNCQEMGINFLIDTSGPNTVNRENESN